MKHYVTIGAVDFARSTAFYDAVLATIGYKTLVNYEGAAKAYSKNGVDEGLIIWVTMPNNREIATFGNGSMVGLNTDSHANVDAFYKAALDNAGTDEGAPGLRDYTPTWYGAYVRDPVGNKLSVFYDA
jgi:catechol 2,3-dioxygenase-like lactoylglutathione lyase family enzyme